MCYCVGVANQRLTNTSLDWDLREIVQVFTIASSTSLNLSPDDCYFGGGEQEFGEMLCKFAFSWVHTRTFLLFQWLHRIFSFTDVITASSRGLCLTISINMGHNKLLSLFHPWYHNWQCCQRGTRVWVTPVDILSDNWRHLQPFLWYQNLVFFSGRGPFPIPGSFNIKKCSVSTDLGFCRLVLS